MSERNTVVMTIMETDDGRYFVQAGGTLLVPLNLPSLVECAQDIIMAAFGKCGKNIPEKSEPLEN